MQMAMASDQALCLEGFVQYAAARDGHAPALFRDLGSLLAHLAAHRVDLVMVDLALEDAHPIAVLRGIVEAAAPTPVAVLDLRFSRRRRAEVVAAGCAGYLVKTMTRQMVFAGLDLVLAGVPYHVAEIGQPAARNEPSLTERQFEVLRLLVEGMPNKEIARRLDVTIPTVKLHVNRILRRLGVRNRTEAAVAGLALLG